MEDFDLEPMVQVGAVSVYQAYRLAVMHTKTLRPLPGQKIRLKDNTHLLTITPEVSLNPYYYIYVSGGRIDKCLGFVLLQGKVDPTL